MNCPCNNCTKRWVSETSRCHVSCIEYKEWSSAKQAKNEARSKYNETRNQVGNVLFRHKKK